VRSLVEKGRLDGYWQRTGRIYRFFVYARDLERFTREHGVFPTAKQQWWRDRTTASPGASDTSDVLTEVAHLATRLAAAERRAEDLEARVQSFTGALTGMSLAYEALSRAVGDQEEAADHLRQADAARSRALQNVLAAASQHAEVVEHIGTPDHA
jgi:chromosome segregation ATPase